MSYHCQWQDLKDLLRKAGNIVRVDIACGADGRSRGFGTALFGTHEGAKRAIGKRSIKKFYCYHLVYKWLHNKKYCSMAMNSTTDLLKFILTSLHLTINSQRIV